MAGVGFGGVPDGFREVQPGEKLQVSDDRIFRNSEENEKRRQEAKQSEREAMEKLMVDPAVPADILDFKLMELKASPHLVRGSHLTLDTREGQRDRLRQFALDGREAALNALNDAEAQAKQKASERAEQAEEDRLDALERSFEGEPFDGTRSTTRSETQVLRTAMLPVPTPGSRAPE